jgi:hypothetical protein
MSTCSCVIKLVRILISLYNEWCLSLAHFQVRNKESSCLHYFFSNHIKSISVVYISPNCLLIPLKNLLDLLIVFPLNSPVFSHCLQGKNLPSICDLRYVIVKHWLTWTLQSIPFVIVSFLSWALKDHLRKMYSFPKYKKQLVNADHGSYETMLFTLFYILVKSILAWIKQFCC